MRRLSAGFTYLTVYQRPKTRASKAKRRPLAGRNVRFRGTHALNAGAHAIARLNARAFRAAGRDHIARVEREKVAVEGDQVRGPVLHVAHEVARTNAVVVFRDHLERVHVRNLVRRDNYRPETEKRVDAFGARQVSRIFPEHVEG